MREGADLARRTAGRRLAGERERTVAGLGDFSRQQMVFSAAAVEDRRKARAAGFSQTRDLNPAQRLSGISSATVAISGRSNLVVQGSAGTTEDHIRYGWNYALLLAEGPSERALVPSPVLEAMRAGRIVRIEEITRCPPEIQDTLISILSEKQIAVPELNEIVSAERGFNLIATANTALAHQLQMDAPRVIDALNRRVGQDLVRRIRFTGM